MVYLMRRRTAKHIRNRAKRNRIYLGRIYATRNVLSCGMDKILEVMSKDICSTEHNIVHIKILV